MPLLGLRTKANQTQKCALKMNLTHTQGEIIKEGFEESIPI